MPDVAMCSGVGCPLQAGCYRAQAQPSEYQQTYFTTPPYDAATDSCDHLWVITKRSRGDLRGIRVFNDVYIRCGTAGCGHGVGWETGTPRPVAGALCESCQATASEKEKARIARDQGRRSRRKKDS